MEFAAVPQWRHFMRVAVYVLLLLCMVAPGRTDPSPPTPVGSLLVGDSGDEQLNAAWQGGTLDALADACRQDGAVTVRCPSECFTDNIACVGALCVNRGAFCRQSPFAYRSYQLTLLSICCVAEAARIIQTCM